MRGVDVFAEPEDWVVGTGREAVSLVLAIAHGVRGGEGEGGKREQWRVETREAQSIQRKPVKRDAKGACGPIRWLDPEKSTSHNETHASCCGDGCCGCGSGAGWLTITLFVVSSIGGLQELC